MNEQMKSSVMNTTGTPLGKIGAAETAAVNRVRDSQQNKIPVAAFGSSI